MPNPRYNVQQVVSTMLMIWVTSSMVLLLVTLGYQKLSDYVFGDKSKRDLAEVNCVDYAPTHGETCY